MPKEKLGFIGSKIVELMGFESRFHDPELCVHADVSPFVTNLL